MPVCGINLPIKTKVRGAYKNVFRLLFGHGKSCSASDVCHHNFDGRMRKHINDFTMRVGSSNTGCAILITKLH